MEVREKRLKETIDFIRNKGVAEVEFGLILGSGLGELANEIENTVRLPYKEIPNFPVSTVAGHSGQMIYGVLAGKKVIVFQGRFHFYEGYSMQDVTYPIQVMRSLETYSLIVTNAAGGISELLSPGNLMLITDHINFMGTNPLIGPNKESLGPRFTDMSDAYDLNYRKSALLTAEKLGLDLKQGVYIGFTGPSYETPSEINFARLIGADAVGMSTIPEVIEAVHCGMRVLGISCITNMAAGLQSELNHEEVVAKTMRVKNNFKQLVMNCLADL